MQVLENTRLGTYITSSTGGETVRSFVPPPLPPVPPVDLDPFQRLLEQANQALGRLDGLSTLLNVPLFLYNYVRKEAVLSSQIEGTQSSLSDLLLFESDQARAFQPWTCKRFPTTSPRLHLESNGLRLFPCHSG